MVKIDEKTYVSFGLIISIITAIIGGAAWLTNVRFIALDALAKGSELRERLEQTSTEEKYYRNKLIDQTSSIDSRLSRIEGKLDVIQKKMEER